MKERYLFCVGLLKYSANEFNKKLDAASAEGWTVVNYEVQFFGLFGRKYFITVKLAKN